eukprot:TRINITY_DN7555_c1_g1_i1.p1 TRINITY_DN7555_c1_g1~~TRINITY_DN7555_c1_g1_i1.p1  ORF type:complete len:337 (+),score=60.14 TRINITY_DN7555_c1_g1_i1:64-1011(+)
MGTTATSLAEVTSGCSGKVCPVCIASSQDAIEKAGADVKQKLDAVKKLYLRRGVWAHCGDWDKVSEIDKEIEKIVDTVVDSVDALPPPEKPPKILLPPTSPGLAFHSPIAQKSSFGQKGFSDLRSSSFSANRSPTKEGLLSGSSYRNLSPSTDCLTAGFTTSGDLSPATSPSESCLLPGNRLNSKKSSFGKFLNGGGSGMRAKPRPTMLDASVSSTFPDITEITWVREEDDELKSPGVPSPLDRTAPVGTFSAFGCPSPTLRSDNVSSFGALSRQQPRPVSPCFQNRTPPSSIASRTSPPPEDKDTTDSSSPSVK